MENNFAKKIDRYRLSVRKINPWLRFLLIVVIMAVAGAAAWAVSAYLTKPLTAQSTLTLSAECIPASAADAPADLAAHYSEQITAAVNLFAAEETDAELVSTIKVVNGEDGQLVVQAVCDDLDKAKAATADVAGKLDQLIADRVESVEALQGEGCLEAIACLLDADDAKVAEWTANPSAAVEAYLNKYPAAETRATLPAHLAWLEEHRAAQEAELALLTPVQEAVAANSEAPMTVAQLKELAAVCGLTLDDIEFPANEEPAGETLTAAFLAAIQPEMDETAAELASIDAVLTALTALNNDVTAARESDLAATRARLDEALQNEECVEALIVLLKANNTQAKQWRKNPEKAVEAYLEANPDLATEAELEEYLENLTVLLTALTGGEAAEPQESAEAEAPAEELDFEARAKLALQGEGCTEAIILLLNANEKKAESYRADPAAAAADYLKKNKNAADEEKLPAFLETLAGKRTEAQALVDVLTAAKTAAEAAPTMADLKAHAEACDVEVAYGALLTDDQPVNDALAAALMVQPQARMDAAQQQMAGVDQLTAVLTQLTTTTGEAKGTIETAQAANAMGRTILPMLVAMLIAGLAAYILFSGMPLFDVFNTIFFALFTLLCVFPFYYLFINTISDNDKVTSGMVNFYPIGFHVNNYISLKDVADLGSSVVVTVARTIIGTALMVLVSAWAGYMVTKQKMWKRSFMYRALVITMYFNAGLIPWYMNMLMLGLTNNFLAYIIPGMIAPYNIILVKTYIESIPASLEESAVIDGANTPTVFTKIILPLSVPIPATIAIFGAVGNWNSFQDSLLLMSGRPEMYTLQHRLYVYLNQSSNLSALVSGSGQLSQAQADTMLSSRVIKYTISMVSIIPILCVYPFMQRFFVKGIMLGAVKG